MGSQSEAFLNGLGDEWLERNRADLGREPDLPMRFLHMVNPGKVLEIGCANGWRLKKLQNLGWDVYGADPSSKAVFEAAYLLDNANGWRVRIGTAEEVTLGCAYDVVILGGCMCLADPEDWPAIVANVDRHLKMGGHLLINDFDIGQYGGPLTMTQDTVTPGEPYHPFKLRSIYWPSLWINFPTYHLVETASEVSTRNVCYMLQKERHYDCA